MPPPTDPTAAGPPPPHPPPPPGWPGPRRLRRRPDEGPIGGVCAGIAEYFNVDPVIVRIAAVVLLFTGPGGIAYILGWIFIPAAEGPSLMPITAPTGARDRGAQIFGVVLLALAVSFLLGDWWSPGKRWFLPFALIALGSWLLLRREPADGPPSGPQPPWPPPGPGAAPWSQPASPSQVTPSDVTVDAPADRPAGDTGGGGDDATSVETSDDITHVAELGDGDQPPPVPPWHIEADADAAGDEVPVTTARRRRLVTPVVMGALLVWSGIAWLAGISVENALAVGLCIVGVGFVLGAFMGGAWGLIIPAVLIAGALLFASIVDIPLSGPIGERVWAPLSEEEVSDGYELSIGEGTLDLTALDPADDEIIEVTGSVGIGHLIIEVPSHVGLLVDASASAGEVVILGRTESGLGVDSRRSIEGEPGAGTIELDLKVGLGQIEIHRVDSRSGNRMTSSTTTTVLG